MAQANLGRNLNYVRRVMRHPCAAPDPLTIVETGLSAGALAIVRLTTFGCTDILKSRAGRAPFHARHLNALIKGAGGPVGRGVNRFLFATPYNQLEAFFWHWLVFDTTVGFFADWASMMYMEGRCAPRSGSDTFPLQALYLDAGDEGTVQINGVVNTECYRVGGNTLTIKPGCEVSFSAHCQWIPFNNDPANYGGVTTYWREIGGGNVDIADSLPAKDGSSSQSITMSTQRSRALTGERTYELKYFVTQGLQGCQQGSLTISGYGRAMPLIPQGCIPKAGNLQDLKNFLADTLPYSVN